MSDEQVYWSSLIADLRKDGMTLEQIAEAVGVGIRQVSNWINGDRPLGLNAVRLYELSKKRLSV